MTLIWEILYELFQYIWRRILEFNFKNYYCTILNGKSYIVCPNNFRDNFTKLQDAKFSKKILLMKF